MLWDLKSDAAESFFKSWNTSIKLIFEVPRNTFTFLFEDYFAHDFPSLRNQIFCRYGNFFKSLTNSSSKEARFLASLIQSDPKSVTCKNLKALSELTQLDEPQYLPSATIKSCLPIRVVPENERWRIGLLDSLLKIRDEKKKDGTDSKSICAMLESLCNT